MLMLELMVKQPYDKLIRRVLHLYALLYAFFLIYLFSNAHINLYRFMSHRCDRNTFICLFGRDL